MLINLIENIVNFLKGLKLYQIVLYQVILIFVFQLIVWIVEYFVGKI